MNIFIHQETDYQKNFNFNNNINNTNEFNMNNNNNKRLLKKVNQNQLCHQ